MGYKDLKFDPDSVFLVTGGAGFIGSNICEALVNMGYRVRCLDNLSTGRIENLSSIIRPHGVRCPGRSRCLFYTRRSIFAEP